MILRRGSWTPLVKTYRFCQLPRGGSLWRNRKLCRLTGNFAAMPKAPSQRTTSPGRGKMSRSDKKGNLSSAARLGEFAPIQASAPPLPQEAGAAAAVSLHDPARENAAPECPRLRSNESPSGAFKRQNGLALARWRGFAPTSSAGVPGLQIKNHFSAEYIRVAAPCVCFVP